MKTDPIETFFPVDDIPGLGPEARTTAWSLVETERVARSWSETLGAAGRSATCLEALALLWHDHLDEGHRRVQDLPGADAAWVHGIVHRREPDYSNARYWFHRAAGHEALEPMAEEAAPILAAHAALPFRLIRDGRWDPFAFVDAVSSTLRPAGNPETARLLKLLQRIEFLVLARTFAAP